MPAAGFGNQSHLSYCPPSSCRSPACPRQNVLKVHLHLHPRNSIHQSLSAQRNLPQKAPLLLVSPNRVATLVTQKQSIDALVEMTGQFIGGTLLQWWYRLCRGVMRQSRPRLGCMHGSCVGNTRGFSWLWGTSERQRVVLTCKSNRRSGLNPAP